MGSYMRIILLVTCILGEACGFPRPVDVPAPDSGNAGSSAPVCSANQFLRCTGDDLVRCNSDGTAEISGRCALGCNATGERCNDANPSNGLAPYLDMAAGEPDLDLGTTATFSTSDGTVVVDGRPVKVQSALVAQASAPTILVFMVHSLVAHDVTVSGNNAFALVSNGDVQINGIFAASASSSVPGPGRFNDGTCMGGSGDTSVGQASGGCGGGGFGSAGGKGGSAINTNGTAPGGAGGSATGNPVLVPLRGGCDSGRLGGTAGFGAGGGAIQLVSRTKITVTGVVAANGSSLAGGGSGGGILLEAPLVSLSGSVVANGGAGAGGCVFPQAGEDGRLDATPATGGDPCGSHGGQGGNGGAGNTGAGNGVSVNEADAGMLVLVFGGYGGGGVGRIRVNTIPDGLNRTGGLFSPNPSTGTIASR